MFKKDLSSQPREQLFAVFDKSAADLTSPDIRSVSRRLSPLESGRRSSSSSAASSSVESVCVRTHVKALWVFKKQCLELWMSLISSSRLFCPPVKEHSQETVNLICCESALVLVLFIQVVFFSFNLCPSSFLSLHYSAAYITFISLCLACLRVPLEGWIRCFELNFFHFCLHSSPPPLSSVYLPLVSSSTGSSSSFPPLTLVDPPHWQFLFLSTFFLFCLSCQFAATLW